MIELASCPICNGSELKTLFSTFSSFDESFSSHNAAILNHILRNVLRTNEVMVDTKQCRQCRQIFFSPTFSQHEMNRLYSRDGDAKLRQFYKLAEDRSGLSWYEDYSGDEMLGKKYEEESRGFRRKFIHDVVMSFKKKDITKLLDIGGGDGSNVLSFDNCRKYVYDPVILSRPYSQIEFINDLSAARAVAPFDLIVSTHTLEHVIHVRETVASYAELVTPGSLLYVEVPAEYVRMYLKYLIYPILKKGAHINWHVNYFSPGSLRSLFDVAGYNPLYLKTRVMPYGILRMQVIVGLFEYTGNPGNIHASNVRWYADFVRSLFMTVQTEGFRKLFKRYPKLHPFSKHLT